MAEPPPPPPLPLRNQSTAKVQGSTLPPSSRYPVLVSGQVSFTTEEAIKDIERVPQHVYRIQVELQPRTTDSTFSDAPWTLVARHFFSTIQLYDDTAIIIRKKENTLANKISGPEELPENPDAFERDYAYDVKLKSKKSVTFKIIVGTKQPFKKTFMEGPLYKKLVSNDWYVKYVRLESQGTVAAIGHLMFAHNRFVNQEDVISELRNLIYPTQCDQIDVRVTKSKEYYYEGNKKMRVFTKWITIDCPVDIATDLSNLIMERWKLLQTETKYKNYNLKDTVYVPRNRGLVNFDARIDNIARQNEFLRTYRDVTVLSNVRDIDATFRYSEEMGEIFGDKTKIGHHINLREFLRSWKDNTTEKPAIIAIHRTSTDGEYSLLSGHENMPSIHSKIRSFVAELKTQLGHTAVRVGGTKGTQSRPNYSDNIKNYTSEHFATKKKFNQKPQDNEDTMKEKNGNNKKLGEDEWKSPPLQTIRQKKGIKASLNVNYNDRRLVQEYKDVVVGNAYDINNQGIYTGITTTAPNSGNTTGKTQTATTNNTITIHEGIQTGIISRSPERQIINNNLLQQVLESKQFQDTLANAVTPMVTKQVTSLVNPTMEKITNIENQVGELHEYVNGNTQWQKTQADQQSNLQDSMNQMQMSMNAMITLFREDKEKESGQKRPAPSNVINDPIKSPIRKQKVNNIHYVSNTPDTMANANNKYNDEACNPHHLSQHTFTEESIDEAMTPNDASGEGEGQ